MPDEDEVNPFQRGMVDMLAPEGSGESVSARGFTMKLDKNRCVKVPSEVAEELSSHGFTRFAGAAKAK
jgi:hypothetical protein